MTVKKSKRYYPNMELYISWMLGSLLLLISNRTIFKNYNASIGDPWLNLFLSAIIIVMLIRIAGIYTRAQRDGKLEHSRIREVDRLDEESFGQYMEYVFQTKGWAVKLRGSAESGVHLLLTKDQKNVYLILRKCRRKLTHDNVLGMLDDQSRMNGEEPGQTESNRWIITNGGFTTQAKKEASAHAYRICGREALIDRLAGLRDWDFE